MRDSLAVHRKRNDQCTFFILLYITAIVRFFSSTMNLKAFSDIWPKKRKHWKRDVNGGIHLICSDAGHCINSDAGYPIRSDIDLSSSGM
jgi:hypothetical protein